jgi:hypothetical protein
MSDFNILNLFDKFINEQNNTEEEQIIQNSVENNIEDDPRNLKAPSKKRNKKTINQDANKKTEEEELVANNKEYSDDEVYDDSPPIAINIVDSFTFKKLIDALNMFRASHSLTDTEIMVELENYYDRLDKREKSILYVFIKGLTQVTSFDAKGKSANIPTDFGLKVEKKGSTSSEKIKSKKRKIKASIESDDVDNMSPIIVGEGNQQKKEFIYKVLQENR